MRRVFQHHYRPTDKDPSLGAPKRLKDIGQHILKRGG